MSKENVELHARGYDAFNRRNVDYFLAHVEPNAEFVTRNVALEGGRSYRGIDGARRWWWDLLDAFPDWRVRRTRFATSAI